MQEGSQINRNGYEKEMEQIRVLINLADELVDEDLIESPHDAKDLEILADLLGRSSLPKEIIPIDTSEDDDEESEDWDALSTIEPDDRMDFTVSDLPALVACLGPLKDRMGELIREVRRDLIKSF